MSTCAFDQLVASIGRPENRRAVFQTLGASALAAGTGLAGLEAASGKKGKKGKKRKRGAPPAPQDLVACQDVILNGCLVGDTVCIAAGEQCCGQLAAGRTADAVRCLLNFGGGRVQ